MKKIFAALCALLLVPTLASAGGEMISVTELREQVTALGRWQKTYSAYGRIITVDIQTIVPDVDRFPIVTCEELIQTEDEKGVLQNLEGYRQVLCANSFTSLAELSLHRAGKPALNYLIAEDRERVKGGEAACEALDVNSVFCYQPASSSCISMYFMLMYFFPPHWVPAT